VTPTLQVKRYSSSRSARLQTAVARIVGVQCCMKMDVEACCAILLRIFALVHLFLFLKLSGIPVRNMKPACPHRRQYGVVQGHGEHHAQLGHRRAQANAACWPGAWARVSLSLALGPFPSFPRSLSLGCPPPPLFAPPSWLGQKRHNLRLPGQVVASSGRNRFYSRVGSAAASGRCCGWRWVGGLTPEAATGGGEAA
jgi:hypothetical protein